MNHYLETIELRTTGLHRETVEGVLENLFSGMDTEAELARIQVYNSPLIESDFGVHIHFQAEDAHQEGSPLGLRMVAALKDYGLVNHHIWCEMTFPPQKINPATEEAERMGKAKT
ncbi:MAG: hypothetical protein KDC54_06495 [Lewinella sp.]|nr:hypothetical protein [Lewinella sp.]